MFRQTALLIILVSSLSYAQESGIQTSGEVNASAYFSSGDVLPFWFYTSTFNRVGSMSDYSLNASVSFSYEINDDHTLEAGASGTYRNGFSDEFQRIDLYLGYTNRWFDLSIGARRDEVLLDGLSASNQNFIWSQNARPLPGVKLQAPGWVRITNGLFIDWSIAHYFMNDSRYVDDTRVHAKDFSVKWNINSTNAVKFKIQHVAQWGGTSPTQGEQPNDLEAFFDVFRASRSNEELPGNALGNHLGSYLIEYELNQEIGSWTIYHEHPFEDGSGTRLANFPDGVWGISFAPNDKRIFSRVLYEFITTKDQSGSGTGSGFDRYFSNRLYRTGWAYEQTIIGFPFITFDPSRVIDEETTPISNDVVQLHHFAANGFFGKFAWVLKSSVSTNSGTLRQPFPEKLKNWYNVLSVSYDAEAYGLITLITGADMSNLAEDNFGAGIQYSYKF